jgi:hypothetical protein
MKTTKIIAYLALSVVVIILATLLGQYSTNPLLPMTLLAIGIALAIVGITTILSRK